MQKLIAKYGTAAHLAILAVAPLFLFPFYGDALPTDVLLWLSLAAASWVFLEPSMRRGEMLHDARRRVTRETFRDPVFWLFASLVLVTGCRALNTGIRMVYSAEEMRWAIASAPVEFFPGCAKDAGSLPFAATVAVAILVIGCRQSLGGAARLAFSLVVSTLAGIAGVVAIYLVSQGHAGVRAACDCSPAAASFVGTAFLVCFLYGILSAVAAFERKWYRVIPLLLLSIGGTGAAGFVFSPARNIALFAIAAVVLILYMLLYAVLKLGRATEFEILMMVVLSLAFGAIFVIVSVPASIVAERVAPLLAMDFLPNELLTLRKVLSEVAIRIWKTEPWLGSGLGTFALGFRFQATPEELLVVPACRAGIPNGYGWVLAERGIVGVAIVALPVLFLLFAYVRRAVLGIRAKELPHPLVLVGPLSAGAVFVAALFDVSFLRGEVVALVGASLALSANSFLKLKRGK